MSEEEEQGKDWARIRLNSVINGWAPLILTAPVDTNASCFIA